MSPGFRRLGEQPRYQTRLITVVNGTFAAPDGRRFERDVVHHPGAVSVVPVVDGPDGGYEVLLVSQYRAAVDRELLEVVAGKRDVAGEPPEYTAQRELSEEVGMTAGRLDRLGEFFNSPGFCDEHSFVFLGRDLVATAREAHGIEEQFMTVLRIPLDLALAMIGAGDIVDAKTIIGLLLARDALARQG